MAKGKLYRFPRRKAQREQRTYRKTVDLTGAQQEQLTGQVQGKKASDLEERFVNVLNEHPGVDQIRFRTVYDAGASRTSFGSIELDVLFRCNGQWYAVQIDEEYFHSSAEARARDRQRDDRLFEILKGYGVQHINRVESVYLDTVDLTRATIEEIIHGRHYQSG